MVAEGETPTIAASDWLAALDTLVRAARASRAIHRPVLLLYLLGRAQRREPREVTFSEVEQGIKKALQDPDRPQKKAEPLLPFWHLRSSLFWEVSGEALANPES